MIDAYEVRCSYKILILKHDEYLVHYLAENNNCSKTQTSKCHKIKKELSVH